MLDELQLLQLNDQSLSNDWVQLISLEVELGKWLHVLTVTHGLGGVSWHHFNRQDVHVPVV